MKVLEYNWRKDQERSATTPKHAPTRLVYPEMNFGTDFHLSPEIDSALIP